jgi:hypothetical protein
MTIALLAILLAPAAPDSDEDHLASEARQACASGQVARAIQLLGDYLRKTNDATAIFNMGRCYQLNGQADRALLSFREYLRTAPDLTADDRQEVDRHIAELEARRQPPSPVTPPALVEATAAPRPTSDGNPVLRALGIGLGAAGVAAVATATIFGLHVRSINDDLHSGRIKDLTAYQRRIDDGARAETLQWVFLGIGAATLAGGAVCMLLALPPRGDAAALAPLVLPGGAGLAVAGGY